MAAFQNFRSALNGFNREDVVRYIELVNNKHASEVNQLHTQLQALQAELETLRGTAARCSRLETDLTQAQEHSVQLEQALSAAQAELEQAAQRPQTDSELEAYRRAERAERVANERVQQLYDQANGILADATVRADETVDNIDRLTAQVCAQLQALQSALSAGANTIRDTAAAMYAIKPISGEE